MNKPCNFSASSNTATATLLQEFLELQGLDNEIETPGLTTQ